VLEERKGGVGGRRQVGAGEGAATSAVQPLVFLLARPVDLTRRGHVHQLRVANSATETNLLPQSEHNI